MFRAVQKVMFLTPTSWGWMGRTNNLFVRNCMKYPDLHIKIMYGNPLSFEVGRSRASISKNMFCIELNEMSRSAQKVIVQTPTHILVLGGVKYQEVFS